MKWLLSIVEGTARTIVKTSVIVALNAIKLKPNAETTIAAMVSSFFILNENMAPKTFAKTMVEAILEGLGEA